METSNMSTDAEEVSAQGAEIRRDRSRSRTLDYARPRRSIPRRQRERSPSVVELQVALAAEQMAIEAELENIQRRVVH